MNLIGGLINGKLGLSSKFIGPKRITKLINSQVYHHTYVPRRAVLYVPGNDLRKLQKIPSLNADCIVMDCEDGVAVTKKDSARQLIKETLSNKLEYFVGKDCSVRFNSVSSDLCQDDMKHILSASNLPSTVHLPKVESIDEIKWFSETLKTILSEREMKWKLLLIMFIESASALLNLHQLCLAAKSSSQSSPFILDGIVYGSDDYCADIGATRTSTASESIYARQHIVAVAKAMKIQAIDLVYIDYKDLSGLKAQSEEGAQWGFTGKQVIHPGQIAVVQEAFTPSRQKLEWAQNLIDAFHEHQEHGKGAFTFEGSMIDRPLLLQAQNIIELVKHKETTA